MLTKMTRRQLFAFGIVTTVSILVMMVSYLQIPQMLGIGRYEMSVDLPSTGGLYPKSQVTYRGEDVGVVRSLELHGDGVRVLISVDDDVKIPVDSVAEVRSASAIGEQYLNFDPNPGAKAGGAILKAGDTVPASKTKVPISTGNLLESVNSLFQSIPRESLSTAIDELGAAFGGNGPEIGRLLDSAGEFQDAADENLEPTVKLLRSLQTVLGTQARLDEQIKSWTTDSAVVTETLADKDQTIRNLIRDGSPLTDEVQGLVSDLDQTLPMMLTDLAATSQVLKVYLPGIKHLLIVLPAAIEAHYSNIPPENFRKPYIEANLSFKTGVNDPPVCTTGFPDNNNQRSPKDTSLAPLSPDAYCKVPHDDQRVVRGARNNPCPNDPTRYSANAAGCGLVFQPEAVERARLLGADNVATYDPATGQLLAPNGKFFLLDNASSSTPPTWQELMVGLVK